MAYLKFYNPYFFANRDENEDNDYDHLIRRFGNKACDCRQVPSANITESEKEFRIEMALPGVDKNNISIRHENGLLTVSVEKPQKEESAENYNFREFDYSGSSRVFKTGDKIDAEHITATYEQGILSLILPKKEAFVNKPAQTIKIG